jgi:lipopolysaccharide export system protein LptA
MELEADSLTIDESKGISLYEGHVEITQGSFKLWADRVWVFRRQGKTEKLVSEGEPTRFKQLLEQGGDEVRGKALKIEVDVEGNKILLIDEALLEQPGNKFGNDRILYNRANTQVKAGSSAQGKRRVHVVIEPKEKAP